MFLLRSLIELVALAQFPRLCAEARGIGSVVSRIAGLWLLLIALAPFQVNGEDVLRPIVFSPSHVHDRFQTQPADLVLKFGAYTASFVTGDDENGNGEADFLGVPQLGAYQLNTGPVVGSNVRPEDWISLSPTDDSYRNSGYFRGHMCGRAHAQRLARMLTNYNSYCRTSIPYVNYLGLPPVNCVSQSSLRPTSVPLWKKR